MERRVVVCALLVVLCLEPSLAGVSRARSASKAAKLTPLASLALEGGPDEGASYPVVGTVTVKGIDGNEDVQRSVVYKEADANDEDTNAELPENARTITIRKSPRIQDEAEFSEPNDDDKNPQPPEFREDGVSSMGVWARSSIQSVRRAVAHLWFRGDHVTPRKTFRGALLYLTMVGLVAYLTVMLIDVVMWDRAWIGHDVENAHFQRFLKVFSVCAQIVSFVLLIGPWAYQMVNSLREPKQYVHDSVASLSTVLARLRPFLPYSLPYTLTLEQEIISFVSTAGDVMVEPYQPVSYEHWFEHAQEGRPDILMLLVLFFHPQSVRVRNPPSHPLPGAFKGQAERTRLLHLVYEYRIHNYKWTKLFQKEALSLSGKDVKLGDEVLTPAQFHQTVRDLEQEAKKFHLELVEGLASSWDNWRKEEAVFQNDVDDPVKTLLGTLGSWGGFVLTIAYLVPSIVSYAGQSGLGCPDPNDENGRFPQRQISDVFAEFSRVRFPYAPHARRWLCTGNSCSLQCEAGYSAANGGTACTDYGGHGAGWSHLKAGFSSFPSCCPTSAAAMTLSNFNATKLTTSEQYELRWKEEDGFYYSCGDQQSMAAQVCDVPTSVEEYDAEGFCTKACKGVVDVSTETPACRYRVLNPIVDTDLWREHAAMPLHPLKLEEERYGHIVQSVVPGAVFGWVPSDVNNPHVRLLLLNGLVARADGPWVKI